MSQFWKGWMDLSLLPVLEGIMRYIREENIPFSMPGHKAGRGFMATEEGKHFYENIIIGDITEVEGLDNLHSAEGIIKSAQELLRDLYGSKKSYFLVNGSTSGNLAMIFSSFDEGDKIIVERNCHRSVFNAVIMRKLNPIYIKNRISKTYNAPLSIDMEHFLQLIHEHGDAKGIVLTYPNYYGICVDLEKIIREARKKNMKVLIDSAHGAHFGATSMLPENAIKLGADMVVMSAHKTLPSLTQTAYLHVGHGVDTGKVDFYVSAFTTTSPSYMFLASMDYSRFYLQMYGKSGFEECIELANSYRNSINKIPGFHVIGQEDMRKEDAENLQIDESRYVISLKKGLSGHRLLQYLREVGIQGEMSDESNVVLIFSPFNKEEDFEKLYKALVNCPMENLRDHYKEIVLNNLPQMVMVPHAAFSSKKMKVCLKDAIGKISGSNIVPYPPGIPLIMLGEIIEEEAINMIEYYLNNNITVLGIDSGKLEVIDSTLKPSGE